MTELNTPPKMSFATFFLKVIAGGFGGLAGSLIMLLIFVLASSPLTPLSNAEQVEKFVSPIFIFVLMIMIFLSSTVGNILSSLLQALVEKERYKRMASTTYQIFIVSIIIFVLMVPVYFIAQAIDFSALAYAVGIHLILTAIVSVLIMEIVSNYKYALLGLYSVAFAIMMSATILFGMAYLVSSMPILLFAALPVIWGSIAFCQGVVTVFYNWIVSVYDKDFLSTQTLYGADYGKEVEGETVEENYEPKIKDEEGKEFLKKI